MDTNDLQQPITVDQKLNMLVDILTRKQILSEEEAERILALKPFAKA